MKKIRNLKEIKVVPTDYPIRIYPDNNLYHVAYVNGYKIHINSFSNPTTTMVSLGYTLDDLKQLRKEIRKVIRNESNKQL